ncbi:hypothetical protein CFP71_04550 [Amycolatopsis thailandensis]|uniref:DUF1062 domain-containing protein n=1 Tax=Amycolatopsis thailandensis TaxID=589330 RepID=A0A229SGZ2_9PSEU|nr:DUF1062 domain-containing protein [Amycolatopsis thailandensis]OXM57981.1 hypothetical protein CFP71_04550 [Amycolatopsis thailandensis]
MLENWVVVPTCLPVVLRRCHVCPSGRFRANGKFRVNANHKLLDAWLLVRCVACGDTAKLTILERVNVRSVRPRLLVRLHENDPALAAELLADPVVLRRNRVALDWEGAWRLSTGAPGHQDFRDVSVRFAARIPVRPVRLIAEGCGLSRAEVERLIEEGKVVSAVRLRGKVSGDFTFTLKRPQGGLHGPVFGGERRGEGGRRRCESHFHNVEGCESGFHNIRSRNTRKRP